MILRQEVRVHKILISFLETIEIRLYEKDDDFPSLGIFLNIGGRGLPNSPDICHFLQGTKKKFRQTWNFVATGCSKSRLSVLQAWEAHTISPKDKSLQRKYPVQDCTVGSAPLKASNPELPTLHLILSLANFRYISLSFYPHPNISDIFIGDQMNISRFLYCYESICQTTQEGKRDELNPSELYQYSIRATCAQIFAKQYLLFQKFNFTMKGASDEDNILSFCLAMIHTVTTSETAFTLSIHFSRFFLPFSQAEIYLRRIWVIIFTNSTKLSVLGVP